MGTHVTSLLLCASLEPLRALEMVQVHLPILPQRPASLNEILYRLDLRLIADPNTLALFGPRYEPHELCQPRITHALDGVRPFPLAALACVGSGFRV